jgi:hypothetical protein
MTEKELENKIDFPDTNLEQQIRARNVFGMFQTVSTAPTLAPKNFQNQIQIYVNGATLRLYCYDTVGNLWHYITFTA